MSVVTRFAPSPTGHMHVGNLRTALFAYLIARKAKGKFILRIEDTDRTRLVEDSVTSMMRQLKWLGVNWDEGPIFQSERLNIYQKAALKLIEEGAAYYCFCTSARLSSLHDSGVSGYDRHCRNLSKEEIGQKLANKEPYTIRVKLPAEGSIVVNDQLRGEITYDFSSLEDLIILKSDGFPTYHLAHPVDDADMGVTHVIRGTEWIPTSPIHTFLFHSLRYHRPVYCHLPLILSKDGGKLSKRDGATTIDEFINQGYLPEALTNFLVLLGWAYDDKRELFTLEELESLFEIDKISKSSAVFNFDKLNFFNNHYIKNYDLEKLFIIARPFMIKGEDVSGSVIHYSDDQLKEILKLVRSSLKNLKELSISMVTFNSHDHLLAMNNHREVIPEKITTEMSLKALELARTTLDQMPTFPDAAALGNYLTSEGKKIGVKNADLYVPIRVAITGQTSSPSISDLLFILGKEESLVRIDHAIKMLR